MRYFDCPYLGAQVELTDERERHIITDHPDLLAGYVELLAQTLGEPDAVYRGNASQSSRRFLRWYDDLQGGKHLVVVVVSDLEPRPRHWIITAHISGRALRGEPEWQIR